MPDLICLREYVEWCNDGKILISVHNRPTFAWSSKIADKYINTACKVDSDITHPLAWYKNYDKDKIKANRFRIGYKYDEFEQLVKNEQFPDGESIIINLEDAGLNDLVEFNSNEKYFMKDGRHKTQIYILLCYGYYFKFLKNDTPIRYYQKYNINKNGEELILERSSIVTKSNKQVCYLNSKKDELYILFKCLDDIIYPTIKRSDLDILSGDIENFLTHHNIKIPNLASKLYADIMDMKYSHLIYTGVGNIKNKISFHEINAAGKTDGQLASAIRHMQIGEKFSPLEVFKNYGENALGIDNFKDKVKKAGDHFVEKGFGERNVQNLQKDIVIFFYSILSNKNLGEMKIEEYCDDENEHLEEVAKNWDDILEFVIKVYEKLESVSPAFINNTYRGTFSILLSLIKKLGRTSYINAATDWNYNSNAKFLVKLFIWFVFKLYPSRVDKNAIGGKLIPQGKHIINDIPTNEIFDNQKFNNIIRFIDEFAKTKIPPESKYTFKKININDMKSNFRMFASLMYGKDLKQKENGKLVHDEDHDLCQKEARDLYPRETTEAYEYFEFWEESIYNKKPLEYQPNRGAKGDKTQKEWYSDKPLAARDNGIDLDAINEDKSPLERMKANKIIMDKLIIDKLSPYGFTIDDFDFTFPPNYYEDISQEDEEE